MGNVEVANRDINSLQPVARKAARLFLEECKKRGIDIFVTEYQRSQERQDWLYEQGRTRPGQIVTWTRNSNHTSGYAWDIAVNPPHDLYDKSIINKAGEVAYELDIEWGGTWKTVDLPHFQVNKDWVEPNWIREDEEENEENEEKERFATVEAKIILKKIEIRIDGKIREVEVVNIEDHNYVKLRDLENDKIKIGYDGMPIVEIK